MKRNGLILVALADTSASQPTVRKAVSLAKHTGASLHLFRCIYDPILEGGSLAASAGVFASRRSLLDLETENLERLAERLRGRGLTVTSEVRWGHPAYSSIIRAVARCRAQWVVAGTHSYGKAARLLLGHNDWQLVRLCPAPLLLVKSGEPHRNPTVMAAVDPGHRHDKPAQLDASILRLAGEWAASLHGKVHVVHAYQAPTPMAVGRFGGDVPPGILGAHREAALHAFEALTDSAGIKPSHRHFVQGSARDVLPAMARRLGAQLVVLGCVSRGRLERALIGSTAEGVVDRLECDLLVVKPRQFRAPALELSTAGR